MEEIVSGVALALLDKLATEAYQKIVLACGLEGEIEQLRRTMDIISGYLVDAENKQVRKQSITRWLQQLRDAFYDASDILDEIEYETLQNEVVKEYASVTRKVGRFFSGSNPFVFRIVMSRKIRDITDRIKDISSTGKSFGLDVIVQRRDNDGSLVQMLPGRETHSKPPRDVRGRDKEKKDIIGTLMKPQSQANIIDVIPIVGIGGLGKTTLAQLVYDDKRVANNFMRLWVCVSTEFEIKRLIADIIQEADKTKIERNPQNSKLEQLRSSLHEVLSGKKFLLVLDDVWNEDAKRWQELKDILLGLGDEGNENDSKIIVTTRSRRVAEVMGTVDPYELKGLPIRECRALFFKRAFPNGGEESHPTFMDIGAKIVNKCKGVPLVAVTLGCLLSSNYDEREWEKIENSEFWELEEDGQESPLPGLKLSYDQLAPSQLKHCFSLCSIFPKHYGYHDFHMIPFWMAHGLLQPKNNQEEPERIGESYIKRLFARSFFQHEYGITKFAAHSGNISVTMHDFIHDLAISTMRNEQVAVTSDYESVDDNVRHLSFWNNAFPMVDHNYPNKVRTINAPMMKPKDGIPAFLDWIFNKFKYIRVLDLSGSRMESLPDCLGELKHLRYLRLIFCDLIKELPNSICDLHSLQCLNLTGCKSLIKLPENMGRFLVRLRNVTFTTQDTDLSYIEIGRFKYLQLLAIMHCDYLVSLPRDLWCLSTLKKLLICNCPELVSFGDGDEKDANLMESLKLQILEIWQLPKLTGLPCWLTRKVKDSLEVLSIAACPAMSSLPEEIVNLRKLVYLDIRACPQMVPKYQRDTGSEWHKISHIRYINLK